ncbi:MAG: MgtC/SapB family protein [Chloroflexi bacterium]|nr:MgtC/SapB family protein [Chloroflexota bacterium]
MFIWLEAIGKLLLSALLGGIIGWEREKQHKPAGITLISGPSAFMKSTR